LHETKIPAIYVTHDQDEAFAIADRILLLHEGEIVRAGTPAEVWANPGSAWAARFLNAGNVLEGEIQRMSDEAGMMNVETMFGGFPVKCDHHHSAGDKVSLLLKQSDEGQEIKLKVQDVLFDREQFQVSADGLIFQMKEAPAVGQIITMKVQVKCLV
jgi:ABC-type Fe3+/spermidine/putrescine transport system ATPase subunit